MSGRRPHGSVPQGIALVVGPDAGHALPVLGIGAELRRRGHPVEIWTGRQHAPLAARHAIGWHELPHLPPRPDEGDLGARLHAGAVGMAHALTPRIRASAPALVVFDTLTGAGALTAAQLGLPAVEVIPHHLPDPAPDLPPVGMGRRLARTPWRRWDDGHIHRRQVRSHDAGRAGARAAARSAGLPDWPRPALRVLQTLPSLERRRAAWPEDAVVAGPLALDPALPPLAPPEGDDPLVVVTDSTATGIDRSLAESAIRGLTGLDLRVVVTTGRQAPTRSRRLVVGTGPHAPLLAQAALAVSPAGGGFVTKAAAAGVPQVVVPLAGDQREAAARLRDAGVGLTVRRGDQSPRALRWAVVRALADPRLVEASAQLAREAASLGPAFAADRCLEVLAGRR